MSVTKKFQAFSSWRTSFKIAVSFLVSKIKKLRNYFWPPDKLLSNNTNESNTLMGCLIDNQNKSGKAAV